MDASLCILICFPCFCLLPPQISSVTSITSTFFLSIMRLFPISACDHICIFSEVPHKVFCWPCLSQWSYRFPALHPNGPCEHGHPKWTENSVRKPVVFIITGFFSCFLLDLEEHSCFMIHLSGMKMKSTSYFSRSPILLLRCEKKPTQMTSASNSTIWDELCLNI